MMTRLAARMRSLLRGERHRPELGARMNEHVGMRAEPPASRGPDRTGQLGLSWLDFKVGVRMLARYPGLTLVGTVAIAVAIALGSIYFEALNKWQNPRLPIAWSRSETGT